MQTAADAAAIACATALREAQTVSSVARAAATLNGFTDDSSAASVAVNNPRTSGTYFDNPTYVEVVVTQPQSTYFSNKLRRLSAKPGPGNIQVIKLRSISKS
jgi:hypothetical protein